MSTSMILFFLYADFCIALGFYVYLSRIKKRIGFQLAMNTSIVMGGMLAFLSGILLILHFPFHFTYVTIAATVIGIVFGSLFGLLFDYQTFVTGLTNGIIIGLMSPMIGTVIEMPFLFVIFIHSFFGFCLLTIVVSIKRA